MKPCKIMDCCYGRNFFSSGIGPTNWLNGSRLGGFLLFCTWKVPPGGCKWK